MTAATDTLDFTALPLSACRAVCGEAEPAPRSVCAALAELVREVVAPAYRRPFPAVPTFVDPATGERVAVPQPLFGTGGIDHDTYLQKLRDGEIVARLAHGVTHAVRVTLFAQALAELYRCAGRDVGHPFGVAAAAAFHDIARQEEGRDRWDAESAARFAAFATAIGSERLDVAVLRQAIAEKDPPSGGGFHTDAQRIVHDADCLDIMRALGGPSEFRRELLCIYAVEEFDPDACDRFVEECLDIVIATEAPSLKQFLEQSAVDAYDDFATVLWQLQQEHGRWPLCGALWREVFAHAQGAGGPEVQSDAGVLFHASPILLDEIAPRKRSTPGAEQADWPELVYASDTPAYAAAHAFPWGSELGIRLDARGDAPLKMWVPEQHRHRLERPMYLYTVPRGSFLPTAEDESGLTYHSRTAVRALSCTSFASVEAAITHFGGIVYYEGAS